MFIQNKNLQISIGLVAGNKLERSLSLRIVINIIFVRTISTSNKSYLEHFLHGTGLSDGRQAIRMKTMQVQSMLWQDDGFVVKILRFLLRGSSDFVVWKGRQRLFSTPMKQIAYSA